MDNQSSPRETFPIIKPDFNITKNEALENISEILDSNMVTGVNNYVESFENIVSKMFDTDVIALSSCTSGMVLVMNALDVRNGEVIMPSFSFSATAHMAYWNNNKPVFADIKSDTINIDPKSVEKLISDQTKAILAVHMYGNPADIKYLQEIAEENDLKLLFDAAHAFGSEYQNVPVANFGDATSFSLSPTKVLSTVEGGIVSSKNNHILEKLSLLRNYGNKSDYTCPLPGLNARMSEIHAAIGLANLKLFENWLENRIKIAHHYETAFREIEGITLQTVDNDNKSTYKDFSIFIDEDEFGFTRDELSEHLQKYNIDTKYYFYPPQHELQPYKDCRKDNLEVTNWATNNVLSIPIWNSMNLEEADFIIDKIIELKQS